MGSVTSAVANLTVTNAVPSIGTQPQNQSVLIGNNATFSISVTGTGPFGYQWFFNTNNLIDGATTNTFTITSAQLTNAGGYSVVITNSVGSVTSKVATLTIISATPNVVAQWNFNSLTPDGLTTSGTTSPSIGSGTASLIGGATATFATGDTARDPAGSTDNSGWNSSTYPAQGTGNKTRGVRFQVSTLERQNIVITWAAQSSGAGSKYARLQYTTNGTDFIDFPTAVTNAASFAVQTNILAGIPGVSNNPNFAFQIMAEFESSALNDANANYVPTTSASYNTSGTMRYDMVTVLGTAMTTTNPPANPAVLGSLGVDSANRFQFTITGSAGSNYVIQVSTNLSANNWISIYTNAAPFTFTESNAANFPQGFYRATALP
jgi:hypothetical protein